jgi:4-amino-4-deoxy-L-arabinose transferase-like glycosyltransferase
MGAWWAPRSRRAKLAIARDLPAMPVLRRHAELEAIAVVGVLLALAAAMVWFISLDLQPSWDEAVYLTKARSFTTDIPASSWLIYRPPGVPVLGLLAAPFGESLAALRLVAAAAGVATVGAAWALARSLWGRLAAFVALLALVSAPVVLQFVPRFRTDIVSVGPVVLLLLLLWWQFERRDRADARLVAAAPLVAAAFYFRYGAAPLVVGVAVAALVLWPRRLWSDRKVVALSVLATVALLAPHVADAVSRTGSPLGIVRAAVAVTDTTGPATAVRDYVLWTPTRIAGGAVLVVAAAAIAAALAAAASVRARAWTPDGRRLALALVPAVVGAAGIVLISHPEPRYMLGPFTLAVVAGAGAVADVVRRAAVTLAARRWLTPAVGMGLAAVVVGALVVRAWASLAIHEGSIQWLRRAAAPIAADAGGRCVVIAAETPVVGWYSRCEALSFRTNPGTVRARVRAGALAYVVFATPDVRGTSPARVALYWALAEPMPLSRVDEGPRHAEAHRLPL